MNNQTKNECCEKCRIYDTFGNALSTSDKCPCHSTPTTEEVKYYITCIGNTLEVREIATDKLIGRYDGKTWSDNTLSTTEDWEKWVKVLAHSKNPADIDSLLIAKIRVLLESERIKAKEEEREQLKKRIEDRIDMFLLMSWASEEDVLNEIERLKKNILQVFPNQDTER